MKKRAVLFVLLVAVFAPSTAVAQDRWAVIVSGASGGEKYAEQMATWRTELRTALVNRYQFKPEFVKVLVDETAASGERGTADNVRKLFAEVKKAVTKDDLIFFVMLGHGTYDGDVAKFNLVGPDLTAKDWNDLLHGLQGRVVLVNTTAASFPFLESLTQKGRVVITATDSAAQKYATVFPEYFVKAITEASTDLDKNGRTSVYEVFQSASAAVKQHYEQRGQLTTERALLDGEQWRRPGPGSCGRGARWRPGAAGVFRQRSRCGVIESGTGLADQAPPGPRAAGRRAQRPEGCDARCRMECAVREAHARARAGLRGDPQEVVTGGKEDSTGGKEARRRRIVGCGSQFSASERPDPKPTPDLLIFCRLSL